jgi:hypothetical protein
MLSLGVAVLAAGSAAFTGNQGAPSVPTSRLRAVGPERLFDISWGEGAAELGKVDGNEGASLGPMSFALGEDGTYWFLDQTRFRLAQFDEQGTFLGQVPIPYDTFQEFEVLQDGSFVLLDRLVKKLLVVVDESGNTLQEIDVEGPGIPIGGGVTAMLVERDGLWLEFDHTERVHVLDENLQPSDREIIRGRPFRPGVELVAALDGRGGVSLWTEDRNGGYGDLSRHITANHDINRIIWMETDETGDVHIVFHLMQFEDREPFDVVHEEVYGIRYDGELRPRDSWTSPYVIQEWDQFREIRIAPDGTVYQMGFGAMGVSMLRWRWVQ